MFLQILYRSLIELSNNKFFSTILEKFSRSKLSSLVIKSYAKVYHINQEEMEFDLAHYPTLEQLFIRKLKPETRPIPSEKESVVSPVDGIIVEIGDISAEKELYVKGKPYSIQEMLGNKMNLTKYIGGSFIILYLSPSHYHRIHSPVTGKIIKRWTLGRKSYPVNKFGLRYGKSPLSKNYRKMTEIMVNGHYLTVAKVGAMYINSIHTTHLNDEINIGEELAYFSFGSTVILLFEANSFHISATISTPEEVKVGQQIGIIKNMNMILRGNDK